jgi:phage-related protein
MSKILVLVSILAIGFWAITALVSAQEQTSTGQATTSEVDLGVENPGILPSSPFYFLKEWRRSITKFFTTNPVKKAELELNEANERAAEIKKLEETAPSKIEAITKAADNYQRNMERLKTRLEQLKQTSENPNVDKLVENVIDRSIKHNELFDNLKDKFQEQTNLKDTLEAGQKKISEVISEIPQRLENATEFQQKILDKIQNLPDSPLKEVRAVEILNKIEQKLPGQQEKIQEAKDNLIQRAENKLNKLNELRDLKITATTTNATTTILRQEIQERIQEIKGKINPVRSLE